MSLLLQKIKAFWTVSEKEVLPDPHRSTMREAELQHKQFAYMAKIRKKA